jgi:hypothetical protein
MCTYHNAPSIANGTICLSVVFDTDAFRLSDIETSLRYQWSQTVAVTRSGANLTIHTHG